MPSPGEYGDCLRAVGLLLDSQAATWASVQDEGEFLAVSWYTRDGALDNRSYREMDLAELRSEARRLRGGANHSAAGERCELLRTVGQDLDLDGVSLQHLVLEETGITVRGIVNERPLSYRYSLEEVRALSAERRALRHTPSPPAAPPRPWWRRLFGA